MTTYEKWGLFLSIVAILIPIIQWIWNEWIQKPVLNYISAGRAYLFCNKSGSYIRVDGVFEALNKAITLKKVWISINREKDSRKLNLQWSTFSSPVTQSFVGNYIASADEAAHPFRVEANSVACAFIEFASINDSAQKMILPSFDAYAAACMKENFSNVEYHDALKSIQKTDEYSSAYTALDKEFFWDVGAYTATIQADYGKTSKKFTINFSVSESDYAKLRCNIDELLNSPIKARYGMPLAMQSVKIDIK